MIKRKWWLGTLTAMAILLGLLAFYGLQMAIFSLTPLYIAQPVYYELKPGSTIVQMANDLQQVGVLHAPKNLVYLARLRGLLASLRAGEYSFEPGTTPYGLLTQVAEGRVIIRQVTIPEGWTFDQMMAILNENLYINHSVKGLAPDEIMSQLGYPGQHPEGLFFPDTYRFIKGTSDKVLLKKAYQKMQKVLAVQWQNREPDLPYENSYQALIAASLVEKETAIPNERPLIGGVIINRLNKKMMLQFDPTVIYGLGKEYTGKLTHLNLQVKSPYNTYQMRGLPPTPIAMPGAWSINAVLHPVRTDYIYFVAKGDGSHVFSSTLQAHEEAIKTYLIKP